MPESSTNETIIQPNPYAGGRPALPISMPRQGSQTASGGSSSNNSQGPGQNTIIIDDEVSLSGPSTSLNGTPQQSGPSSGGNVQPTTSGTDFNNAVVGMKPGASGAGQNQSSGSATGWWKNGNNWYYFDPATGNMVKGWKKIDGYWYYLDLESGIMATGWVKTKEKWYYLNPVAGADEGKMLTGWQYINGEWYYLETDGGTGEMNVGWKKVGDGDDATWYYLFPDGAMAHDGWVKINEKWYCFNSKGEMQKKSIIDYQDKKYYVDKDGVMLTRNDTETVEFEGVTYDVDWDGVCTPDESLQNKLNVFVQIALNEKGTEETGTNKIFYNDWFYKKSVSGSDFAWCSVFVLWAGNEAGILDGVIMPTLGEARKDYFEGVRNLRAWYEKKGKIQANTYNPKKGDIIFFTWSHVGIVVAYDETNGQIYTVEGNSGDAVRLQTRARSAVKSFGTNGGSSYGTIPGQEELNPSSSNKYT